MSRSTFCAAAFFLAFSIGLFCVYEVRLLNKATLPPSKIFESLTKTSDYTLIKKNKFRYGCRQKSLESFWEELDKTSFLDFKKREIKISRSEFKNSFNKELFEEEWENFLKRFGCSYFEGIETEADLNNDDVKELFVRGQEVSSRGETEMFIFQRKAGSLKMLLFDKRVFDIEIKRNKTNSYSDISTKTYYVSGNTDFNNYRFNDNAYNAEKCFSEKVEIWKDDRIIKVKNPVINRFKCDKSSSILK